MRRVEINNEIVLLRQSVRQARICVINKLVREAKRLRSSHGNEKQLGKCKNKADKLLREVSALKYVKDDEILKFGIIRFDYLQTILQSPQTDDGIRVMAKVVRYKSLSAKILEFREKYPDYSKHISWTKKKMILPERKRNNTSNLKNVHSKSLQVDTNCVKENLHKDKEISYNTIPIPYMAHEKNRKAAVEHDVLIETVSNTVSKEEEKGLSTKVKIVDVKEQAQNNLGSKSITKAINSQVIVKKFTEFLQEMELKEQNVSCEETKNDHPANRRLESLQETNDFFLHAHDAVSHSNVTEHVRGTNINRAVNVNDKSSMSFQIQPKKNTMNIERINKERTDYRRQRMHSKHLLENRTSRPSKQSKFLVGEGRSLKTAVVLNNESLHPSWAAKKKQQDIMKQGFQGKKIKFNED